ncbi:MAG: GspH/FimT family pseudopilin [Xanthomonadaceae bacterium]|nr:GspH/FimT family pseudopilin [Xanthomonadaceae bacterium]MDE1886433.1 GspH/FimT family pseudopilin [Xanthomonadaceae bacterium]MDE2085002.1 GspH/FimT family pseudopilin [Xanthomonadaceae bacterium]MDE2258270.1 GspH/FimT family pseudopilin [Xanthomonadaceae bacterium]
MPRTRQHGFTLIELVAVIVLIGIALSVVSLSFSKSMSSAKIQAATRDLVAALRYTRGQAIVTGKQAALDLDIQSNTYQAPGRPLMKLPKDMHLVLLTADSEQTSTTSGRIRFFPDGASTGGHISVRLGEREWRINVSWLTGEVTREETAK